MWNLELCIYLRIWCLWHCIQRELFSTQQSIKLIQRKQASNGELAYDGNTNFYASAVPSGQTQETVSTQAESVTVTFQWQSK